MSAPLVFVASILVVWRALLQLVYDRVVPRAAGLPNVPAALAWWPRWDGGWYLSIAQHGYTDYPGLREARAAFFPLYPLAVRALARGLGLSYVLAGVLLSHAAVVVLAYALYRIAALQGGAPAGVAAVGCLLVYPSSFFLAGVYAIGPVAALMAASTWFGLRRRWWVACTLAGLAGATALTGLVMLPVLALLYARTDGRRRVDALWLAACPVGTGAYAAFLWRRFGSATAWFTAERVGWRRHAGLGSLGHLVLGVRDVFRGSFHDRVIHGYDFVVLVVFLVVAVLLVRDRRWSLGLLVAAVVCLPAFSGEITSMNRYALAAFPAFAWAGVRLTRHPLGMLGYGLVCVPALVGLTAWFLTGRFVG